MGCVINVIGTSSTIVKSDKMSISVNVSACDDTFENITRKYNLLFGAVKDTVAKSSLTYKITGQYLNIVVSDTGLKSWFGITERQKGKIYAGGNITLECDFSKDIYSEILEYIKDNQTLVPDSKKNIFKVSISCRNVFSEKIIENTKNSLIGSAYNEAFNRAEALIKSSFWSYSNKIIPLEVNIDPATNNDSFGIGVMRKSSANVQDSVNDKLDIVQSEREISIDVFVKFQCE